MDTKECGNCLNARTISKRLSLICMENFQRFKRPLAFIPPFRMKDFLSMTLEWSPQSIPAMLDFSAGSIITKKWNCANITSSILLWTASWKIIENQQTPAILLWLSSKRYLTRVKILIGVLHLILSIKTQSIPISQL